MNEKIGKNDIVRLKKSLHFDGEATMNHADKWLESGIPLTVDHVMPSGDLIVVKDAAGDCYIVESKAVALVRRADADKIGDACVSMLVNIIHQVMDGTDIREATANMDCDTEDDIGVEGVLALTAARYDI